MGEQQTELVENKRLVQGDKVYNTPVEVTLEVIGGKWKSLLVYHLQQGAAALFRTQAPGAGYHREDADPAAARA